MTPSWGQTWMAMARTIAQRSKDPNRKHGAVVVRDREVLGMGYNGPPACMPDSLVPWDDKEAKQPYIIHAEMNAVRRAIEAHGPLAGSMLYVTGRPCPACLLFVASCDIQVVIHGSENSPDPWANDRALMEKIAHDCGVSLRQL